MDIIGKPIETLCGANAAIMRVISKYSKDQ